MADRELLPSLRRKAAMPEQQKPRCAVHGMVRPGGMCSRVIVGMEFCGAQPGTCPHQRPAEDSAASLHQPEGGKTDA